MTSTWLATMKPSFTNEWSALPAKELVQVLEKIKLLEQDPTPDAKVKKQLKYKDAKLYRIRSGDYRIFYTFEYPHISLLALRRRSEDTYDEDIDAEFLGGLDVHMSGETKAAQPDWERLLAPKEPEKKRLPEPITVELLTNLRIPKNYHARLLPLQLEDDLLDCPGVPNELLNRVIEFMFPRPLSQVLQQPDYMLQQVDDLLRFKEGELLGFLLKLSPEQEKYVSWAMNATGPTLLKGGPGTGKSTIALYRVRSLVESLRKKGRTDFRILFTTYTNVLVKSSQQLLQQLLGEDMRYVEVQTADSIAMSLLNQIGAKPLIADHGEVSYLLKQAVQTVQFEGNPLQQQAQKQAIQRLSIDYLQQEINQVLIARQIETLEDYLAASRPGRRVRLNALQRRAVWSVYEQLRDMLKQRSKVTWRQARAIASVAVMQGHAKRVYDAVIIDEAQDLDPSALRLLIHLCTQPNRVFITADANQSIYGSGFNWADVHESLRFQGRTAVLHANYRSTSEIGEAAQSYLAAGMLDTDLIERTYVNSGPLPVVRATRSGGEEVQLLARFLTGAAREYRLSTGACAILCPTVKAGKAIAAELTHMGVTATFMSGQELNLIHPGIKVLTLNSSKGLEFPIVALSGFTNSGWYGTIPTHVADEEREEFLAIDRRTLFVGMTRAMRALLLTIPEQTKSPLLTGFDTIYWNMSV